YLPKPMHWWSRPIGTRRATAIPDSLQGEWPGEALQRRASRFVETGEITRRQVIFSTPPRLHISNAPLSDNVLMPQRGVLAIVLFLAVAGASTKPAVQIPPPPPSLTIPAPPDRVIIPAPPLPEPVETPPAPAPAPPPPTNRPTTSRPAERPGTPSTTPP